MIVSESHGYDITVNTDALEEFDYLESIESFDNKDK